MKRPLLVDIRSLFLILKLTLLPKFLLKTNKAFQQQSKEWLLTGQWWDKNVMTGINNLLSIVPFPNIMAQLGKTFVVLCFRSQKRHSL